MRSSGDEFRLIPQAVKRQKHSVQRVIKSTRDTNLVCDTSCNIICYQMMQLRGRKGCPVQIRQIREHMLAMHANKNIDPGHKNDVRFTFYGDTKSSCVPHSNFTRNPALKLPFIANYFVN